LSYIHRPKHWIVKSHREVAGLSGDLKQTQKIDVTSKPKNSNDYHHTKNDTMNKSKRKVTYRVT